MITFPLPVLVKNHEANETVSLWLSVPSDLRSTFKFTAGQFIAISAELSGETLLRQYSISSPETNEDSLRITVKRVEYGRMSSWLVDTVKEKEILEVAAPRGLFFRPPDEPCHAILLAAGSGVAPMIPIANALLASDQEHRITFVLGSRTERDIILRSEVDALGQDEQVNVYHVVSRDQNWSGAVGRIDRAFLKEHLPIWDSQSDLPIRSWICGPEAFMDVAESALLGHGVDKQNIRLESFDLILNEEDDGPGISVQSEQPGEVGACTRITAQVMGEEISIVPEPHESILDSLLRASADVPFSCQEGTCSSCISKITQGSIEVRPGVLKTLREDDLDQGLTLACLSHPTTSHVRIDFDEI